MEDQLLTAWEIRELIVPALQSAAELALLALSTPLLRSLLPPVVLSPRKKVIDTGASAVAVAIQGTMHNRLCDIFGICDASVKWPMVYAGSAPFFRTCHSVIPSDSSRGVGSYCFLISDSDEHQLITRLTIKTCMTADHFARVFSVLELRAGGITISSIPTCVNNMLARQRGSLFDDTFGITTMPVMFSNHVFPLVRACFHLYQLFLIRSPSTEHDSEIPLIVVDVENICSPTLLRSDTVEQYSQRQPPPVVAAPSSRIVQLCVLYEKVHDDSLIFDPRGHRELRYQIGGWTSFPMTAIMLELHLPDSLSGRFAPVVGAAIDVLGKRIAEFDLVDMCQINWARAGLLGGSGRDSPSFFRLLLSFCDDPLCNAGELSLICTLNFGRINRADAVLSLIVSEEARFTKFSFSATCVTLNCRSTVSGLSGLMFCQ
jgi:hypothetical protein